jgi:acyl carrier protein
MTQSVPTFDRVCGVLSRVLSEGQLDGSVAPSSSLIELGFDSLKLAELMIALEEELGVNEFPMQAWIDEEGERDGPRYTVGSLVEKCLSLLSPAGSA